MKVNVVVLTEYEIDIDDKFKVMDLPECDDGWDEIPTELAQELVTTAQKQIVGIDPVHEPEVSEIYNPDDEVLYRLGTGKSLLVARAPWQFAQKTTFNFVHNYYLIFFTFVV